MKRQFAEIRLIGFGRITGGSIRKTLNNQVKGFYKHLDTDVSKSIIDNNVVAALGFDLHKLENERLTTVGGSTNSKILKLPKFSLFGKDVVNFEVNVLDIPFQIQYFADGLIGMDFLMQFKNIKFDFDEKIIET